jgi:hypothetical protein
VPSGPPLGPFGPEGLGRCHLEGAVSFEAFVPARHVSNPTNDLLSLHPAAMAGSILGARPLQAHAAAEDAEPETGRAPRELRRLFRRRLPGPPQADRPHPRPAAP